MEKDWIVHCGSIFPLLEQVNMLRQFRKEHSKKFNELTDRETEVLTLTAKGLSSNEVAEHLNIKVFTVQNHRAMIREKLSITSPTDYILYAVAYELISF